MKSSNEEINKILKTAETKFGKGTLLKLSSNTSLKVEVISTGIASLDEILGGGFPKGRIIEIFGPESSGKTTISLAFAASVQKKGGVVAFIDAEHSLDPKHASKLGVDPKKILISQPDNGEQGLEIVNYLCEIGGVDLIIIDSVASLTPKAEIDGEIGNQNIGLQARMMSKAMRVISTNASKSKTIVIFINQLREKVGVIFGNPEVTPGGRSLKFYSTIRLDVRIKERLKKDGDFFGQIIKFKTIKNKVTSPYKETFVTLNYDEGFDVEEDYINFLIKNKKLTQKGPWIYQNDKAIGKGKKEAFKNINRTLLK